YLGEALGEDLEHLHGNRRLPVEVGEEDPAVHPDAFDICSGTDGRHARPLTEEGHLTKGFARTERVENLRPGALEAFDDLYLTAEDDIESVPRSPFLDDQLTGSELLAEGKGFEAGKRLRLNAFEEANASEHALIGHGLG